MKRIQVRGLRPNWNVGILARPGATNAKNTDSDEIDANYLLGEHFMDSVWAREYWNHGFWDNGMVGLGNQKGIKTNIIVFMISS
jgi:hypothetical protein